MAFFDYEKIINDRPVNHFMNGTLHLIASFICGWLFWWPAVIIILCNSRVAFDVTLSLLRFGRVNYVSPRPESWVDVLEKKIFGNDGYAPKIIYLALSIVLNIVYFFV